MRAVVAVAESVPCADSSLVCAIRWSLKRFTLRARVSLHSLLPVCRVSFARAVRQIAETTSRDGQVEEALQQQFGLVKLDKVRVVGFSAVAVLEMIAIFVASMVCLLRAVLRWLVLFVLPVAWYGHVNPAERVSFDAHSPLTCTVALIRTVASLLNAHKQGVDGVLSESLMRRYVYDFTCMHAPYSPHIDREAQSTIMWRVLSLFGGAGACGCFLICCALACTWRVGCDRVHAACPELRVSQSALAYVLSLVPCSSAPRSAEPPVASARALLAVRAHHPRLLPGALFAPLLWSVASHVDWGWRFWLLKSLVRICVR